MLQPLSKIEIVEIAPCQKCGARRGVPCRMKPSGPKSHQERLHLAQIMRNAFTVSGEELVRVPIKPAENAR